MESQVRINIESRKPFADGQEFDGVGAYEALAGTVDFAIDPHDPSNETVNDLELAPRNDEATARAKAPPRPLPIRAICLTSAWRCSKRASIPRRASAKTRRIT